MNNKAIPEQRLKAISKKVLDSWNSAVREHNEDPYIKFLLDDDAVAEISTEIDDLTKI